ncbi:hypothetical protein [Nocardia sp. NPDC050793]|uniref:hypothetical protein n=1 Tax=Nocardia sp. NPDC050793 TaxID=3155159 RepID=UPI00340C5173
MTIFPLLPSVAGVEVTQSIQYFRASEHLGDPADQGPDNSVQLMASKPAWVRVYVDPGLFGGRVSGLLEVENYGNDFRYHHAATLTPRWPSSIEPSAGGYADRRRSINDTLNFVIPANNFHGRMRLTLTLTDLAGNRLDRKTLLLYATLRQTLRLRGILVSYNGPASASSATSTVSLAAPTLADLRATAALATRAMPVRSTADLGFAGTIQWNLPLDDPPAATGGTPNWLALMTALNAARQNDGNRVDTVYYGLLPADIPLGSVIGRGQIGLGASAAGNQSTLLHEVGHALGFCHTTGCMATGCIDSGYPSYEPYPVASIGEYGLDVADGTILPPDSTSDFMSRCQPRWMSLFRHKALIEHRRLAPEDVEVDFPPEWDLRMRRYTDGEGVSGTSGRQYFQNDLVPEPVIAVSGFVDVTGHIEVQSVVRISVVGPPSGELTTLIAQLVGSDGEMIARAALRRSIYQSSWDAAEFDESGYFFEAYLPDTDRGAELRIEDTERAVLWRRRAPAQQPRITEFDANATGDSIEIHWRTDQPKDDLVAWAQYSTDDGATWEGLAIGIRNPDSTVDAASLPGGPTLVRIMVHNDFDTAVSDPVAVDVPMSAPEVVILWPEPDGVLVAGGPLRVVGSVAHANGRPLPDAMYHWILDEQDLGDGEDEWFDAPGPGTHRLTLLVHAGGFESERSLVFTCVPELGADRPPDTR